MNDSKAFAGEELDSRGTYKRFARYYDLYAADFAADLPLYLSLCHSAKNILEIGCGTGRVLCALLRSEHSVVGVDISVEMLEIAETKLPEYLENKALRLEKHDFRDAPLSSVYDRALVTWYTFNYLLSKSDQDHFLVNVGESLAPNGLLVMDLFYPQTLARPGSENRWKESVMESDGQRVTLRQKRRMIGNIEERIQIFTDGDYRDEILTERRYVDKQEMAALLKDAGFTNVCFTNGYDETEFKSLHDGETTDFDFVCVATWKS